MSFPDSLNPEHVCSYSRETNSFEKLFKVSKNSCPIQIADPDMFITFQSPDCFDAAQSPNEQNDLSPRSEDSLERTIKKLKLDDKYIDLAPKNSSHIREPSKDLPEFDSWTTWNQFNFDIAHNQILSEQDNNKIQISEKDGSSLQDQKSKCPMFNNDNKKNLGIIQNEKAQNQSQGGDDDVIILNDSDIYQRDHHLSTEKKGSQCLRHKFFGKHGETIGLKNTSKSIHDFKMLSEHEKILWESFVKVHSHIPGFPIDETKHLEYISLILRHKAQHLFNIGKYHQQEYSQARSNFKNISNLNQCSKIDPIQAHNDALKSYNIAKNNQQIENPLLVFENTHHQSLLKKCPVMIEYLNDDNKKGNQSQSPPTPVPAFLATHHELQPLMSCQSIANNESSSSELLKNMFGLSYNHFVRAQAQFQASRNFEMPMGSCPHMNSVANHVNNQMPSRQRREAFKAALTKIKGGTNKK